MPRKPRFFVPEIPNHIIQRGNNKEAVFYADEDYFTYKNILYESADKYGIRIHAYVLMTNHIHLLATAGTVDAISLLMQNIGRFYVPYINHKYKRTGTMWEGRFKSSLVDSDVYVLACMRYIELNPIRANMVDSPQEYKWSSYRANALGDHDRLIQAHESYQGLAYGKKKRQKAYSELFLQHIDKSILQDIRNCVQSGTPLGNAKFMRQIEQRLNKKVGQNIRGRPRNS
ncbi:MAG: transposase [Proteobacteria bacterium]|nr:transposase [Pseudomonadota bacterium]